MHRAYHRWDSPALNRPMELLVFGHAGAPVIVFPTSQGRFFEYEDRGMVGALTQHIEQVWVQLIGLAAVGAFTFSASFGCLWALNRLWGIRVEEETETAGLDVSEHGMWGYPEFYIPVPGGYGTEAHSHLLAHGHTHRAPAPSSEPAAEAA